MSLILMTMPPCCQPQTAQPGTTKVYVRGVASGGDGNHSGPLPSVGVYLDEQPVTTIGGALDVHIYDIARIESLAGPQGTLYGASSEAGTLRIITNKPDLKGFYGRWDADVNTVSNGGTGYKLEGMLNVPISQKIAARFVGWSEKDAGFIDNVAGSRHFLPASPGGITVNNSAFVKQNYNDVQLNGGRAALKVDLDDNWSATATILGQDQHNHGAFGFDAKVGDLKVQHFFPESLHDRFWQAAMTVQGKISNFDVTYAAAYLDRKIDASSDYTDYAEAYDSLYALAGGVAGYFYITNAAGNPIDPRQKIIGRDHFTKESHELRLASPSDAPLRFVGGAFYSKQTHLIHQDYQIAGLAPAMSVNGMPGTLWLTQQNRVDQDTALFAEVSYDILPKLTATLGGRVFSYDNSLIGFFGFGRNPAGPPFNGAGSSRTGVAGCFTSNGNTVRQNFLLGITSATQLPAAVSGSPCTNLAIYDNGRLLPKEASGSGSTYKLNLTWKATKDALFYGTISTGFRPGGINRRGDLPPYASDYLTNYELGWKTSYPEQHLRFNGAIYDQEWKKFQFAYLGQNSFTEIHNGPDARIKGIEADINWSPVSGLNISASAAHTDAKTTKNLCLTEDPTYKCVGQLIVAPVGTRLPVTPQDKAAATVRYSWEMDKYHPFIQGVISYQSKAASDIRQAFPIVDLTAPGGVGIISPAKLLGDLPAFTNFDLSFGTEWDRWTAEVYIKNVADKRGQLTRYMECGVCYQRPYAVPNQPRTISIRLGQKF